MTSNNSLGVSVSAEYATQATWPGICEEPGCPDKDECDGDYTLRISIDNWNQNTQLGVYGPETLSAVGDLGSNEIVTPLHRAKAHCNMDHNPPWSVWGREKTGVDEFGNPTYSVWKYLGSVTAHLECGNCGIVTPPPGG